MGLRELLILLLILAIVGVVLRGLYVALQSRRNQLRVALHKNVPDYDLEELEFSELPSGGARQVERSFARVMQQNSARNAAEKSTRRPADRDIPVLTDEVTDEVDERAALDTHVFVDDYVPDEDEDYDDDDQDYDEGYDDEDEDEPENESDEHLNELDDELDELDDELDEALDALRRDVQDEEVPARDRAPGPSPAAEDEHWLDDVDDSAVAGDSREVQAETQERTARVVEQHAEPVPERSSDLEQRLDVEREPEEKRAPAAGQEREGEQEFEDEYGMEPSEPRFSARDDFDILLDDYEEERGSHTQQLEGRQDRASSRFMQWAGERVGQLGAGGLLRSGPSGSERKTARADKARLKQEAAARDKAAQDKAAQDRAAQDRETHDRAAQKAARQEQAARAAERQNELDLQIPADEAPASEAPAEPEQHRNKAGAANSSIDPDYSEVLVINVMAPPEHELHGDELLPVLLGAGLRFGEMNIFHCHSRDRNGPVLFSVANILNPGTFDLNQMHDMSTRGLCFFLTLPNAVNNMEAFEQMLGTARQVCTALDAELKDDNRSVMTAQTIEHYRERIRSFELRQLRREASRT